MDWVQCWSMDCLQCPLVQLLMLMGILEVALLTMVSKVRMDVVLVVFLLCFLLVLLLMGQLHPPTGQWVNLCLERNGYKY
jgi:hypothetical protein